MRPVDITEVLEQWSDGDRTALPRLMPMVMDELRRMAESHFRKESSDHTLQPTALVNEVYLRLSRQMRAHFESRVQFFAFASGLMRRVLVDHYRARRTAKRGRHEVIVTLDDALGIPGLADRDLLALDDALDGLKSIDGRQARVVELRFFGGLTVAETASVLGLSPATIKREWMSAKAFLLHEMQVS